jgi:exonuclease III
MHRMKLVSANIEGERHLERVMPFVERESPDVLCIQEIFRSTLDTLGAMGYTCEFLPMTEKLHNETPEEWGIAICAKGTVRNRYALYYRDIQFLPDDARWKVLQERGVRKNHFKNGLLGARTVVNDAAYLIYTTHFTWTEDGEIPSQEQIESMNALLAHTQTLEAHLLCGDFNIPRNINYLYKDLLQIYTDNIPGQYVSSLDKDLHRLRDDQNKKQVLETFMVDYLFSQKPYQVSGVRLEFGVSDHAAVIGMVQ